MEADIFIAEGEGIRINIIFRRGKRQMEIAELTKIGGQLKIKDGKKIKSDGTIIKIENY